MRIVKKLLKTTRNKKKRHSKIVILARTKLNSIESKISEALINNESSHEVFITIININKAGLFEGSFFWRDQFDTHFIFQEELM